MVCKKEILFMDKLFRIHDFLAEKLRKESFDTRRSQNAIVNELLETHYGDSLHDIQGKATRPKMDKKKMRDITKR